MTDKEILAKAISLLEKGFCHGFFARDKNSNETEWYGQKAVRYCSVGALRKVALDTGMPGWDAELKAGDITYRIELQLGIKDVAIWNDANSKQTVIRELKKVLDNWT